MMKFLSLMRPHQWTKNFLLLFPPFFGGTLFSTGALPIALPALSAFCIAASASYIINDINDIEADRNHREKRKRALPSGRVGIPTAAVIAVILIIFAFFLSTHVSKFIFLLFVPTLSPSTSVVHKTGLYPKSGSVTLYKILSPLDLYKKKWHTLLLKHQKEAMFLIVS